MYYNEANDFLLLGESNKIPDIFVSLYYFFVDLYGIKSELLSFQVRGDVSLFHTCFSKQTERRQVGLFTGSLWKKLTPRHVALKIWWEASRVAASQVPNARLTEGDAGRMCCCVLPRRRLSNGELKIGFRCERTRPLFSMTMCYARVSERPNIVEDRKRFLMVETKRMVTVVLPSLTQSKNFIDNVTAASLLTHHQ